MSFNRVLIICFICVALSIPLRVAARNWNISGLDSAYKLCDDITFILEKGDDTCSVITIVGAEKFNGKKWMPFTDDIHKIADGLGVMNAYSLNDRFPRISITWAPCKSKYFVRKRSDKVLLKGQFRFKLTGKCDNEKNYSYLYSRPFYVR